jgi:phosphoglycerate dehydrogenase-like enzyme
MEPLVSRRAVLGVASAAAVGLVASDLTAAPASASDQPRLPMNILLRAGISPENLEQLRAISPQVTASRDVPLAAANAVLGNVSSDEVAAAKNLRWVQCPSAGVEHCPLQEYLARDIILTNGQGCYAPEIAEHAFGLLFSLTREIGPQTKKMRERKWGSDKRPVELRGMTMGIVGLGGIGREVARRAKAMDLKVIAVDAEPMLPERFAMVDDVQLVDTGLKSLLERSDIVVLCCPSTPKSRGMIGAEQFSQMKRGAYLVNVARGKLVQTDALMEALRSGQIAGAGLDVTDPEPLPADHALWEQDNVIITSHIAGQSQFSWPRVERVFTENAQRFARGLPMLNVVDKAKGY